MSKAIAIEKKQQPEHPMPGAARTQTESYPVQQEEKKDSWKQTVLYGALAVGVTGLTIWAVRKMVQEAVSNREETKTLEDGSSATIAKQIKMSFDNDGWWGTDEEALRRALRSVQSKDDFDKVKKSYQKLYHRSMLEDMADELTSTEYNEMLQIISAKPAKRGDKVVYNYDAWAKRLRSAMELYYMGMFPGTDEEAIYAVFNEMPNATAWSKVKSAYTRIYGDDLYQDLIGEMWSSEIDELIAKVKKKGS
ncbi:MAG: hypothetical protein ACOZCO_05215 [Bacteroidota bacterium]